jgi:hypothetical protein
MVGWVAKVLENVNRTGVALGMRDGIYLAMKAGIPSSFSISQAIPVAFLSP